GQPLQLRAAEAGQNHQGVDRGEIGGYRKRFGGLDAEAERAAQQAIERGPGVGQVPLVGEEGVLRLRQVHPRLEHVEARHRARVEADLRLLEEVARERVARLNV